MVGNLPALYTDCCFKLYTGDYTQHIIAYTDFSGKFHVLGVSILATEDTDHVAFA